MIEIEKKGLTALASLADRSTPPSDPTSGGGKSGKPIAQGNIELELLEFEPNNRPEWAEEFTDFLILTGQSHVDVATKCSLLEPSCKKKILQKLVKQIGPQTQNLRTYELSNWYTFKKKIVKTCSTWAEVLQRLEKTVPVYETDLSVRTQI